MWFQSLYGYSHGVPQAILTDETEIVGVKPEELLAYALSDPGLREGLGLF